MYLYFIIIIYPAQDIFKYKTTVLIGAGVGVTPYASILKSVWLVILISSFIFFNLRIHWFSIQFCFNYFVCEYIHLKFIFRYKLKSGNFDFGVKKIYFYWLCSDASVFGWFTSLLQPLVNDVSYGSTVKNSTRLNGILEPGIYREILGTCKLYLIMFWSILSNHVFVSAEGTWSGGVPGGTTSPHSLQQRQGAFLLSAVAEGFF